MHFIIVGAGITGLTLAITLARYSNVQITIMERSLTIERVIFS